MSATAATQDFFQCPAYKLLISDLKSASQKHSTTTLDSECNWSLRILHVEKSAEEKLSLDSVNTAKPFIELNLKLVWIQGKVVKLDKAESGDYSLTITDDDDEKGEDEATIDNYTTVPGGDHSDIKIGAYIGALAQLWSNQPDVVLKATKIMYLGDRPLLSGMWKDEVRLAKAFLAGLIVPNVM